ncbi:MAG: hypothetical protein EA405_00975 [Rhodospirillales bacterium]|nr:MAG: hypothetical protein EA405_00975 [Rhodospirillales bacterium]
MRWLVTTGRDVPLDALKRLLSPLGAEVAQDATPVPLGDTEQVVSVEGPRDLPVRAAAKPEIRSVDPDSDMELY